jgi:hypothetical protein
MYFGPSELEIDDMFQANRDALASVDLFFVSEPPRAVKTFLAYNRSILLVLTMGMNSLLHNSDLAREQNDFTIDHAISRIWHLQLNELCRSPLHLCVAASRFEQERLRYYTGLHLPYLRFFGPKSTVDLWGRHHASDAGGRRRGLIFNHARECHADSFNKPAECPWADGHPGPQPCKRATELSENQKNAWPSPAGLNRIATSLGAPIGFEWWHKPEPMLSKREALDLWASFSALLFVPWNAITQTLKELPRLASRYSCWHASAWRHCLRKGIACQLFYKDEPFTECLWLPGGIEPECSMCTTHGSQADCSLHPMNRSAAARSRWLEYADFFTLPHIQQYEDDADLVVKMSTADLREISLQKGAMLAAESAERHATLAMWQAMLSQLVHRNQPFGSMREVPLWYPDPPEWPTYWPVSPV